MPISILIIIIVLLIVLILCSAFFSAAETAYSSISPLQLTKYVHSNSKWIHLLKKHYKSFGWTLATILISNNLVNIGASSLVTYLFAELMGSSGQTTLIATCVTTPFIVIFGEILPKLLAKKFSIGYLKNVVYIIEILNWLFYPLTFLLRKVAFASKITNTEKDIKHLISIASKEGVLEKDEAALAKRALDLDSTLILKIMKPIKEVVYIEQGVSIAKALEVFDKTGFSRLPVISKKTFIGVLLLKNIFTKDKTESIDEYIDKPLFVSQNSIASKVVETLRLHRAHLAMVTDKKDSRKIVGIVTLEDIVEELIGEVYDEHDQVVEPLVELGHNKWRAVGNLSIKELEKVLDIYLETDADEMNLKQWIQSRINRRIKKNLRYKYKKQVYFKVLSNHHEEETLFLVRKL